MSNTYDLISRNVLSSTTTTITFSSIPQTYTDLVLKMTVRSEYASAQSRYRVYVNTLSGTNYNYTSITGSGTSASFESSFGNSFWFSQESPASTSPANVFDSCEWYFPAYTTTTFNKIGLNHETSPGTTNYQYFGGSLKTSTTAITTLYVVMGNGANFSVGSSFSLYGISKD